MRSLARLLICLSAVALASAQQEATHFGGRYGGGGGYAGGSGGQAISKYNPTTKNFEPVTSDRQYTYYRMKVSLDATFKDQFVPDPTKPSLITIVNSGDVFDNSTGVKVGTFDSVATTTTVKATRELQLLITISIEMGPNGDDSLFMQAAQDRANLFQEVTDFDIAVIGGTGRYKGATGEAVHSGVDSVSLELGNLYVTDVAVPKFKTF